MPEKDRSVLQRGGVFAVLLVARQPEFLPGPLVSIVDQFRALVTVVVALVWALVMLIVSIPAIINALQVSGSVAD